MENNANDYIRAFLQKYQDNNIIIAEKVRFSAGFYLYLFYTFLMASAIALAVPLVCTSYSPTVAVLICVCVLLLVLAHSLPSGVFQRKYIVVTDKTVNYFIGRLVFREYLGEFKKIYSQKKKIVFTVERGWPGRGSKAFFSPYWLQLRLPLRADILSWLAGFKADAGGAPRSFRFLRPFFGYIVDSIDEPEYGGLIPVCTAGWRTKYFAFKLPKECDINALLIQCGAIPAEKE